MAELPHPSWPTHKLYPRASLNLCESIEHILEPLTIGFESFAGGTEQSQHPHRGKLDHFCHHNDINPSLVSEGPDLNIPFRTHLVEPLLSVVFPKVRNPF